MTRSRINWVFFCAAAWVLSALAPQARAIYIVNFAQVGPDVVATGSGSINLGGLTLGGPGSTQAGVLATVALEITGPTAPTGVQVYTGVSGPGSFGPGSSHTASSGSGTLISVSGSTGQLAVATGYVSGTVVSDTSTYTGQTFASLGLTTGTYTYTFGSGATADSFVVNIGVSAVPEPRTILGGMAGLLGLGGMAVVRRRRAVAP